ncbi:MAG: divalent-cation tolerance protein CutA [Gammaproteobacteria bacterium]|nr:divalent-cation tolerance protein CutA [Gammaproteobacteria bacterium]
MEQGNRPQHGCKKTGGERKRFAADGLYISLERRNKAWQGTQDVHRDQRIAALQREIRSAHPYTVAEILQFKIDSGDPDYLDWITQSTQ